MSLLNQYLSLNHRAFFKELDLVDVAKDLSAAIDKKAVSGKEVYLYHSDAMKFVISFLILLDKGAAPICLTNSKVIYEDSYSFIDGVWSEVEAFKKSAYKESSYSVLTSGTTGVPKRCDFLLSTAKENARAHSEAFKINSNDEILQALPTYHSYGIVAYILTPLVFNVPVNFCTGLIGLRPLAKHKSEKNYILHISPAQARFILAEKLTDLGSLKKVTIGGGALNLSELEALSEKLVGCEIFVSYGLTEAGPRVSTGQFSQEIKEQLKLSPGDYWIGSPIKNVEIKILENDEFGNGHLGVSSPYLKANMHQDELIGAKWYPTRDHVKVVNNNIIFLSRDNDLLKYGGVTIYPKDIEDQIRKWGNVTDALILKKFDRIYEDVPYLFIEGTVTKEEATERLEKELSQALYIKNIFILPKFPRQSLDKVDRKKLYDLLEGETNV